MKRTPTETEEELKWVLDYMVLPVVLDVLERDIRAMDTLKLKMPVVYMRSLRRVQNMASSDMAALRGKLRTRGIRVYEQRRTGDKLEAEFLCRSYHRKCAMPWGVVKTEVERKLGVYLELDGAR